jgi:hypothetical protein
MEHVYNSPKLSVLFDIMLVCIIELFFVIENTVISPVYLDILQSLCFPRYLNFTDSFPNSMALYHSLVPLYALL